MRTTLCALAAFVLTAVPARAALSVSAELSRTRVSANDQLVLSVTVSGDQASLPTPQLPPISAFSIYESGRSQSMSFVNGRMTASIVYTYVLVPRAVGKHTIPPIRAAGAAQPTAPLQIEVVKESSSPPAPAPATGRNAPPAARTERRPDIILTASLDKPRAFVNQQVTLTVRFLYAARLLGNSRYEAPKLSGFLSEDLPPVREGTLEQGGRIYHYSEIKTALFPVQPGRLTIGPAVVHCQVARDEGVDPLDADFFNRFFSMGAQQPVTLNSDPLTLEVEPLPEGKPADFTGFVGRITASAEADHAAPKVGDALNITVSVSGDGNIKSIPEPRKPDLASVRFFATENTVKVDRSGDRIGGTKTFRTVLVPRVSGEIRVPPVEFSYFDPETRSYKRAVTSPIVLHAAPGTAQEPTTAAGPLPTTPGLTAIESDIRYLKTQPSLSPVSDALAAFASLGLWHGLPGVILMAAAAADWRRRARDLDPQAHRAREALRRAEERLRQAAELPEAESSRAAALIDAALAAFAADKLGAAVAGLTLKSALEGFASAKQPPSAALLARFKEAWLEADQRRFAPGGAGGPARDFAAATLDLLKALDKEMHR